MERFDSEMLRPSVSVVMSVYKEPVEWLRQSIESILNQTFTDFEFIIINDCPERVENQTVLAEYEKKDARIVVLNNEHNLGLTRSLNRGIQEARGRYLARMDADDISLPERFQEQFTYMETHSDCVVCGTDINIFSENAVHSKFIYDHTDKCLKKRMYVQGPFAHPTVFIRMEALKFWRISYNEKYEFAQDFDLWLTLSKYGKFHNLPRFLFCYRQSSTQISTRRLDKQSEAAASIRRDHLCGHISNQNLKEDIFNRKITLKTISLMRKELGPFVPSALYLLYQSLPSYGIKTLFSLLLSTDFIRIFACKPQYALSTLKRFVVRRNVAII